MNCQNHPDVAASATCAGCAEPYCANCVVTLRGATYCASCKTMGVTSVPAGATTMCAEAHSALKYSIVGIFLLGIFLEPIAIAKALDARKQIKENPSLGGKGRADAALVIASVVMLAWLLGIVARAQS